MEQRIHLTSELEKPVLIKAAINGGGTRAEHSAIPVTPEEQAEEATAALVGVTAARLLHGLDAWAWEFVALAAARGYETRTGLEDTLMLPDGSIAANNAALVAAAKRMVATVVVP